MYFKLITKKVKMSDLIELTGLWTGEDKNGNPKMSGSAGGVVYHVLKNTYKRPDSNEPDYRLLIGQKARKDDTPRNGDEMPSF